MTNPQIHLFNWQQNIESGRGDTLRLRLAASPAAEALQAPDGGKLKDHPENQLLKQKVVTSWTKGREEIRARRLCEKDCLHPCFLNVAGYKRFSFGKYLGAPFRDVLFNDPGYSIYWVSSLYAEYVTEGVITDDRMYLVEKGLSQREMDFFRYAKYHLSRAQKVSIISLGLVIYFLICTNK